MALKMTRLTTIYGCVVVVLILSGQLATWGQASSEDNPTLTADMIGGLLSKRRWRDDGSSLTLRLPIDARVNYKPFKGGLVELADRNRHWKIKVYVYPRKSAMKLGALTDASIKAVMTKYKNTKLRDRSEVMAGKYPATLCYFQLPNSGTLQRSRILGQALFMLNDKQMAVIRIDAALPKHDRISKQRYHKTRLMFQALIESVELKQKLDKNDVLEDQVWRHVNSGLSLRPPLGAQLVHRSSDGALLRIIRDGNWTMWVYVHHVDKPIGGLEAVQRTMAKLKASQAKTQLVEQKIIELAGKKGALLEIETPDRIRRGRIWKIHDALFPIDDQTYVEIRLRVKPDHEKRLRPLFETMLESVAIHPALEVDKFLTGKRWQEHAVGLSFLIPKEAKQVPVTEPNVAGIFHGNPGYILKVSLRRSPEMVDASTMGKFALVQFFETYPSATVLSHQTVRCAGSAGTLSFFKVSGGDKAPDAIQAQLLLQVGADHKTFAVMTLISKAKFYDQIRPILESIAHSVKTADPKKLDEYRSKLITQAKQWHAGINAFHRRAALSKKPILMRVIRAGKDLGYMRVDQYRTTEDQWLAKRADLAAGRKPKQVKPGRRAGIGIEVRSRLHQDHTKAGRPTHVVDSSSLFFLSDDGDFEMWSLLSTIRPLLGAAVPGAGGARGGRAQNQSITALETGVREGNGITVSRQAPNVGITQDQWEIPKDKKVYSYVPQVDIYLLGKLLPKENTGLGFYTYVPGAGKTGKLSLRTERIIADPKTGHMTVFSRPLADHDEHVSHYDKQGMLIKRVFPDGRHILVTTDKQLRAIWPDQ
jgi:hypothetical protein